MTDAGAHVMAGGQWQRFAGPEGEKIQPVSAGSQDGLTYMYATTAAPGGLYVARDGARTWEKSKLFADDLRLQSIDGAKSWMKVKLRPIGSRGSGSEDLISKWGHRVI